MFLRHPLLSSIGVEHGFGTLDSLPRQNCRTLRQVHGSKVLAFSQCSPSITDGDGLISDGETNEVGVWTADCLPVLISTNSGSHVGAIHAGWRGATAGIVLEGLTRLKDQAFLQVSDLRVVLGPAIGPCCFEVGPEVWEAVHEKTPSYRQKTERVLDLWELVTHQLLREGVPQERIGRISLCTRCHPELFYSHRGWGTRREGRSMLNFIRSKAHDL